MATQIFFTSGGQLGIGTQDLNVFVEETGMFQADQSLALLPYTPFRIFTKTTANGKVRIPRMSMLALGLRQKDCNFIAAPGASFGVGEFDTCPVKFNSEFCDTEVLDNLFDTGWGVINGEETLTTEGELLLSQFVSMTATAAIQSILNTLTWGKYGTLSFLAGNTDEIDDAITAQWNACSGYLDRIETGAGANPNYDITAALAAGSGGISDVTGAFGGSILDVYDALVAGATPALQSAVTYGFVNEMVDGRNETRHITLLVDSAIYAAAKNEYNEQNYAPNNTPKRLSMVSGTLADFGMRACEGCLLEGSEMGRISVLFIDKTTAVLPDPRISFLDAYTTKFTRGAILTTAQNIFFATSYTSADNFRRIVADGGTAQEIGLLVERNRIKDGDGYATKMVGLITSGIINPAYIAARLLQVTKN